MDNIDVFQFEHEHPVSQLGFAMIYHVLTTDPNISNGAFRLYAAYLGYAQLGQDTWVSRARIASDLGVSESTVSRWNGELHQLGLVVRALRPNSTALTTVRDPRDMPRYKQAAWDRLERRKNAMPKVAKMRPPVSQKCDAEEEEPKKKKDNNNPPPAAAVSTFAEIPTKVEIYEVEKKNAQYLGPGQGWTADCPEESCGNQVTFSRVRETQECINGHTVKLVHTRRLASLYKLPSMRPPDVSREDWKRLVEAQIATVAASKSGNVGSAIWWRGFRKRESYEDWYNLIINSRVDAVENWKKWLSVSYMEGKRGYNLVIRALAGFSYFAGDRPVPRDSKPGLTAQPAVGVTEGYADDTA